jgi:hypothetical protein
MYMQLFETYRVRTSNSGHFFDRASMRFFGSRVMSERLYNATTTDVYFVTSEVDFYGTDRRYTVRVLRADGSIDEVGEFRQHASRGVALRAMRRAYEASK